MTINVDRYYSLGDDQERQDRLKRIDEPPVAPLTEYVTALRAKTGRGSDIPYFDPLDGGIRAQCLFLLEAPGPKAVKSGFVSRNNPDQTARNFFLLNREAGIDRRLTVTWNIVPWYIGDGNKIRAAKRSDIEAGKTHLWTLLSMLADLRCIALIGRKAQRVEPVLRQRYPRLNIVNMMHPSPRVVNTNPANRSKILASMLVVAESLDTSVSR